VFSILRLPEWVGKLRYDRFFFFFFLVLVSCLGNYSFCSGGFQQFQLAQFYRFLKITEKKREVSAERSLLRLKHSCKQAIDDTSLPRRKIITHKTKHTAPITVYSRDDSRAHGRWWGYQEKKDLKKLNCGKKIIWFPSILISGTTNDLHNRMEHTRSDD